MKDTHSKVALIKLGRAMEANRPPGARLVHAQCGRRRGFLSNSDARAYEAGWYSFRDGAPMPNEPGPREDGWKDARAEASEVHAAVCKAVALLNVAPEVARIPEGREARDILRQALVDYADAVMDQPTNEAEQVRMRRRHASVLGKSTRR